MSCSSMQAMTFTGPLHQLQTSSRAFGGSLIADDFLQDIFRFQFLLLLIVNVFWGGFDFGIANILHS
jgi:hypothetical protein